MSKNCAVVSDTGIVLNIVVCHDDEPESANLIRYEDDNPAYIGGTFDTGYFYPPQPYPSWTRSEGQWVAPVSMPDDGGRYQWDEDLQEWVELAD
jgi:hypothetical protein